MDSATSMMTARQSELHPVSAGFTDKQLHKIAILVRYTSFTSFLCSLCLICMYVSFKEFRMLGNMFFAMATPAVMLMNVGWLLGSAGTRGNAPICQAQAFLFEWFSQTDPYLNSISAVSVFLLVFSKASEHSIKKYWYYYCLGSYGIPMIPAIVLAFVPGRNGGHIYGPVYRQGVLWCWIQGDYERLRIGTLYAPVWAAVLGSFACYMATAYRLFKSRRELRMLSSNLKNTDQVSIQVSSLTRVASTPHRPLSTVDEAPQLPDLEAGLDISDAPLLSTGGSTDHITPESLGGITTYKTIVSASPPSASTSEVGCEVAAESRVTGFAALKLYCKNTYTYWCEFFKKVKTSLDPVVVSYCVSAAFFSLSMVCTWLPPSVARLYGMIHGRGEHTVRLGILCGIALPMQGFWNFFIFSWNSRHHYRALWIELRSGEKRCKCFAKLLDKIGIKPIAIAPILLRPLPPDLARIESSIRSGQQGMRRQLTDQYEIPE